VVAEGFEAGGHNGREETTTFVLIPMVRDAVSIPLIAAGGIASGRAMLAAEVLGADGSQVGSRFAASKESSAHDKFKTRVTETGEGETMLTLKQITPVRLIRNGFFEKINEAELQGATKEELIRLLGSRRAKQGIFEGDLEEGELEIGQVSAAIKEVQPAKEIVEDIWNEYWQVREALCSPAG
jgi:enoyl-[acyl-carrier protein] reductase II